MVDRLVYIENTSDEEVPFQVDSVMKMIPPGGVIKAPQSHFRIVKRNVTPPGARCPLRIVNENAGTTAFYKSEVEEAEKTAEKARLEYEKAVAEVEAKEKVLKGHELPALPEPPKELPAPPKKSGRPSKK